MLGKIQQTTVEVMLFGIIVGAIFAGLLWADEREHELGIAGKSSERLLVERELAE
jgi:hypothetical protein